MKVRAARCQAPRVEDLVPLRAFAYCVHNLIRWICRHNVRIQTGCYKIQYVRGRVNECASHKTKLCSCDHRQVAEISQRVSTRVMIGRAIKQFSSQPQSLHSTQSPIRASSVVRCSFLRDSSIGIKDTGTQKKSMPNDLQQRAAMATNPLMQISEPPSQDLPTTKTNGTEEQPAQNTPFLLSSWIPPFTCVAYRFFLF